MIYFLSDTLTCKLRDRLFTSQTNRSVAKFSILKLQFNLQFNDQDNIIMFTREKQQCQTEDKPLIL